MTESGEFESIPSDDCIYVRTPPKDYCASGTTATTGPPKDYCASGTHVDDLFTVGEPEGTETFICTLDKVFELKVVRNPSVITGVQLLRDRQAKWAKLHQEDYTTKLLEEFKMDSSNPTDTPIDPGMAKVLMTFPQDEFTPESLRKFQGLLGKLMWLCCRTRPDLSYTVNLFSRFVRCASDQHFQLLRGRPLKYLNGTRNFGLAFYPGSVEWKVTGSSDADLAGDLNSSRSVLSTHSKIGEFGYLDSSTRQERKICTSTGQAETYAFANLIKEIIWERNVFKDLGFPQSGPTLCYTDNDGVVTQSTKMINHASAKHYRITQAFIRQVCVDGVVKAQPIASEFNYSDIGTKPLLAKLFLRHRATLMGPQEAPVRSK